MNIWKEEITIPQFVLCKKSTCPKIETCYRYRAVPEHENHPYNNFINLCDDGDEFKYHIKIRPDDKIKNLEEIHKNEPLEIGVCEP